MEMRIDMKIIDLLNKIANGEEVPRTIRWYDKFYNNYDEISNNYKVFVYKKLANNVWGLNDEVEIIEEQKKIEKIEMYQDEEGHYFLNKQDRKVYVNCDEIDFMVDKFNELIDEINNLKEE